MAGGEPVPVALGGALPAGAAVQVAIRPESLRLTGDGASSGDAPVGILRGKVADLTFLGNLVDCHVLLDDGTNVRIQADPSSSLQVGQVLRIGFNPRACIVFDA